MEASEGKMPTTSARRLIWPLRRSIGLVLGSFVRCAAGNAMWASTSSSASSISLPSFGQRGRSWSATWRQVSGRFPGQAAGTPGAARPGPWTTGLCRHGPARSSSNARSSAANSPRGRGRSPPSALHGHRRRPASRRAGRACQALRKVAQNVSASDGPIGRPTICRRPSASQATASIAATETMRPPSRWRR